MKTLKDSMIYNEIIEQILLYIGLWIERQRKVGAITEEEEIIAKNGIRREIMNKNKKSLSSISGRIVFLRKDRKLTLIEIGQDLIDSSMYWSDTKEGGDFWQKVYTKKENDI